MEAFLECYLDNFKEAPRTSLYDRRNRQQMIDYVNTLIMGCAGDESMEITCGQAVTTLLKYHNKAKASNCGVCPMGKDHNILYIAAKLCFLWQLSDSNLVCQLLEDIYKCEGTFERLLIGAIFGTKAPHYFAGWKSDFQDQEENVRGMVYFLDKVARGHLVLHTPINSEMIRFIDLPIESCGKASPVKLCLDLGLSDKLLILLRFGATLSNPQEQHTLLIMNMKKLLEFNHCYPHNLVACLQLILRVLPEVPLEISAEYGDLIEDGLIPLQSGIRAPELKHLCRCAIRLQLWKNFKLPHGIWELNLPVKLSRYLDILED